MQIPRCDKQVEFVICEQKNEKRDFSFKYFFPQEKGNRFFSFTRINQEAKIYIVCINLYVWNRVCKTIFTREQIYLYSIVRKKSHAISTSTRQRFIGFLFFFFSFHFSYSRSRELIGTKIDEGRKEGSKQKSDSSTFPSGGVKGKVAVSECAKRMSSSRAGSHCHESRDWRTKIIGLDPYRRSNQIPLQQHARQFTEL